MSKSRPRSAHASSTTVSTTRVNRPKRSAAPEFRPTGAVAFAPMLLADAVSTAQSFVSVLYYVYLLCILAYIITSWIPLPYNVWLNRVQRFLYDVDDPYLRLFRRLLPQLSIGGLGLDLSPIFAIIVLSIAYTVILRLIGLAD